jgi:mRNA interferase RelE/StbE
VTWQVEWTDEAKKALRKLGDKAVARRVAEAVTRFADSGHGDVKKLQGERGYRLRVGDYRVRFDKLADRLVILVFDVAPRREVYR